MIEQLHPKFDGITHLNVYTKAKTKLGLRLTNFSHDPFWHPLLGQFESSEGLHYFLKTGRKFKEFRTLWGYKAKELGVELCRDANNIVLDYQFDWMFRIGLVAKITQNADLFEMCLSTATYRSPITITMETLTPWINVKW